MATVRLGRFEGEEYDLPRVCMRCGARASTWKTKQFTWYPMWSRFMGGLLMLLFAKKMTVRVPLCDNHKWHWGGRMAIVILGLVAVIALFIGGAVIADTANDA